MGSEYDVLNAFETAPQIDFDTCFTEDMELDSMGEEEEEVKFGEEGEDDIEEEEEDEVEDEEYAFRFKSGVNPFDVVGDGVSGIQMYQRFERLEYEALAEKKRKALNSSQSERATKKARQEDILSEESRNKIMEIMNYGVRRKSRKRKKKGRQRGSKSKLSPEIARMLGDATLHYAHGRYEEAIVVLKEAVRLTPNLPDSYHTLGLIHNALGNKKVAFAFYMLAAFFSPKETPLWKRLFTWSIEQGNTSQTWFCLSKAIRADPDDITLRYHQASCYIEREDYQRAADSYRHIQRLSHDDIEAVMKGAKLYLKCNQIDRAIEVLEEYLRSHPTEADICVIDLLAAIFMDTKAYEKGLEHLEHSYMTYYSGKEMPLNLKTKAGICHMHLGNMEKAEHYLSALQADSVNKHVDLITEVADSFMSVQHFTSALKYYHMLESFAEVVNGYVHLKIGQCYLFLNKKTQAITFFYKALHTLEDNVDARLKLASLLIEDDREDEAISLLSPPKNIDKNNINPASNETKPWWYNGKIRLKLCHIYRGKQMTEEFVDTIFPLVAESLYVESIRQKVKIKKAVSSSVQTQRVQKVAHHDETDNVFPGSGPLVNRLDRLKAARAKKSLEKKAALKEEMKAAALASGLDWQSDDSEDESQEPLKEAPLPNLFKEDEHDPLIIELCKALGSLQRYEEALEIIELALKLAYNTFPAEKKEELRTLGAQMAYVSMNPKHGFDYTKYIVRQRPYSFASWNCYYKVISRKGKTYQRNSKFLRSMRVKYKDCVPPILITGHQFTVASHHQDAAREYLQAYKLLPENPLINLCAGTALVNLALGFRLQNKHQSLVQGLAFLHNNLQLCENSQESLYNIARAYQHIGLVSLAVSYYEKVLAMSEKDCCIPKLPDDPQNMENLRPGYCDLRREAAYNLHLIYKRSGSLDLARQVLKDHCTV